MGRQNGNAGRNSNSVFVLIIVSSKLQTKFHHHLNWFTHDWRWLQWQIGWKYASLWVSLLDSGIPTESGADETFIQTIIKRKYKLIYKNNVRQAQGFRCLENHRKSLRPLNNKGQKNLLFSVT